MVYGRNIYASQGETCDRERRGNGIRKEREGLVISHLALKGETRPLYVRRRVIKNFLRSRSKKRSYCCPVVGLADPGLLSLVGGVPGLSQLPILRNRAKTSCESRLKTSTPLAGSHRRPATTRLG